MDGTSYPPFPNYSVTVDGRVFRDGREIRQRRHKNKYLMVTLSDKGKTYNRYVHRMVCETYHGPCPEGKECRHLDGSRDNNCASNLMWATEKENNADKKVHGTNNNGEAHGNAVLTDDIVLEARRRYASGDDIAKIARAFAVSPKTLRNAISGKRWGHLPNAQEIKRTRKLIDVATLDRVKEMLARGDKSHRQIGEDVGLSKNTIYGIWRRIRIISSAARASDAFPAIQISRRVGDK